jgi:site-specific recombinase XerD
MLQLFISRSSLLRRPLLFDDRSAALPSEAIECARDCGVTDGMPFFLDGAGHYQTMLNAFLRSCPTMGVRSANSLKAYALDILIWERFLSERRNGKCLWRADSEDLAAFHAARRRSAAQFRVAASTWNRSVASLQKLYDWAMEEGLADRSPLGRTVPFRRLRGSARWAPTHSVHAQEPAARRGNLRVLDLERYVLFRDVGLRGLCAGDEDSECRGRHGERNALFAEILVTTGLRLQEAASLLVVEIPRVDARANGRKQRSVSLHIAAATAKGNKSREIRLSYRLVRRLSEYIDLERESVVPRKNSARDADLDDVSVLQEHDRGRIRVGSTEAGTRWITLERLSPLERRRLVSNGRDGPSASLWLNERGEPMTSAAWEAVFRRASARCRALGMELDVSPRTLRHVFATNMLAMLIREQIGQVVHRQHGEASGAAAYRRMIGDPLQKLQYLLGHASITSTYIYLDTLDESRALIEAATDRWASMIADGPDPT